MTRVKAHILIALSLVFLLVSDSAFALLEECPESNPNAPSPKKIAIFTDGTGNTKDDQTNVYRLYEMTTRQASNIPGIITYYDRGVGNLGTTVSGGAVGLGLSRNVRQAYRCLADHYQPGDQIYLFGFSRGAYTARVLGGLIHLMGVLDFPAGLSKKDQRQMVEDLYDIYKKNGDEKFEQLRQQFQVDHKVHHPEIEVMGLWDTVAALGLSPMREKLHETCVRSGVLGWFESLFDKDEEECLLEAASTRLYQDYHRTGLEGIRKIYHAVSIDERRNAFKIELYDETEIQSGQVLKQVWFSGVHSDVGGGYEDSDALAGITLNWMIGNLRDEGLLPAGVQVEEAFNGPMHASYKSFYKKVDPKIRDIKPGSFVHISVLQRMVNPLPNPNPKREPQGRYRPAQFEACLKDREPTKEIMSDCYQLVGD